MATVTVTDQVQATESVEVGEGSPLSLANLKSLRFSSVPIISDFEKPLDQSPLDRVGITVGLTAPSALLGNTRELGLSSDENATFSVRTEQQTSLFGDAEFAPALAIGPGECWAGISIGFSLDESIGAASASGFGMSLKTGTGVTLGTFVHFPAAGSAIPSFRNGLKQLLENYSISLTAAQLLAVPMGVAQTSEVSGQVSLGASYALPFTLNPLATAGLPFNLALKVAPTAGALIEGNFLLEGSFIVRTFRPAQGKLAIGLYKQRQTTLSASISASAGLGATIGNSQDILPKILQALTPAANADALDLGSPQKEGLNAALKQCADYSLSIGVNACCTASNSDEAAVSYELDLAEGDPSETEHALDAALHGDWSQLEGLPNARLLRHILRDLRERNHKISLNLLGLYNASSITDYLKSTTVLQDENGQISIVDKAAAKALSAGTTPYAAKADKLRFALSQAFIATVSYGACSGKVGITSFNVHQSILEYHAQASKSDLTRQLALAKVFDFSPNQEMMETVASGSLSHNQFDLDTSYDLSSVYRLFYQDVTRRVAYPAATIDRIGRDTRIALLDPTAANSMQRRAALANDDTWNALNACGDVLAFGSIPGLAKFAPTAVQAVAADWTDIRWWSDAIQGLTPHVTAVLAAVAQSNFEDPARDAAFQAAHAKLRDALARLTSKTHSAFGDGWPVAVMYRLATQTPDLRSSVGVEINITVNGKSQSRLEGSPIGKSNATST